jgi:hypothetical protein
MLSSSLTPALTFNYISPSLNYYTNLQQRRARKFCALGKFHLQAFAQGKREREVIIAGAIAQLMKLDPLSARLLLSALLIQ